MKLTAFEMVDAYERLLTMREDGVIMGPRGFWGQASADGSVTFPDGSVRGKLLADGRVMDRAGVELATVAEDGTAKVGDVELGFSEEGWVEGGDMGQAIRLVGPKTDAKRVAMFVFVLTQLRPRPVGG